MGEVKSLEVCHENRWTDFAEVKLLESFAELYFVDEIVWSGISESSCSEIHRANSLEQLPGGISLHNIWCFGRGVEQVEE